MLSGWSGCTELSCELKIFAFFHLSCLCLQHVVLGLRDVKFESSIKAGDGPDLSGEIWLIQNFLLSNNPDCNIFNDWTSVTKITERVENFARTAFEAGYNPCF